MKQVKTTSDAKNTKKNREHDWPDITVRASYISFFRNNWDIHRSGLSGQMQACGSVTAPQ